MPSLKPSLTYDGDSIRLLNVGQRAPTAFVGNLHLRVLAEAPVSSDWRDTTALLDIRVIHGSYARAGIHDAQGASNIAGPRGADVEELWVQHEFSAQHMSLLLGIYDLNTEFYRLQAAGLFLNSSFGIGPEFSQSGREGPSIFPRTAAGFRLAAKPAPGVVTRMAVMDGVPVVAPDGSRGIFRAGDGLLVVAEVALVERADEAGDRGRDGYRLGRYSSLPPYGDKLGVGVWRYTGRYPTVGPTATGPGNVQRLSRSSGGYLIGEKQLTGTEGTASHAASVFVQLGRASSAANRFASYVGLGVVGSGWLPGRPADQAGLSVARAANGSAYMSAQAALGAPAMRAETTIEASYAARVTSWLTVQPDLQYIVHPNTDPLQRNALVAQLRFEVAF